MKTKRNYQTFDEQTAIRNAQTTINTINQQQKKLKAVKINDYTVVQIRADHPNADLIIDRIKNKIRKNINIEDIEYGHYA